MESSRPSRAIPKRARRRGLLWGLWASWTLLGLAIVLAVGLELALRLAFAAKDAIVPLPVVDPRLVADGYGGASWVDDLFREQDQIQADRHPYVDFHVRPFDGRFLDVGDAGLRQTWAAPKGLGPDSFGVWVFGGSAAWGFGARDDHTMPSLLAKELIARDLPVRVTNRAQIGHVSTQEVIDLTLALRAGGRPDVVVFYGGVNDVLATIQSGVAGSPQNEAHREAEFNILQSPRRLLKGFFLAVARESAFARLAGSAARRLGIDRQGAPRVDFDLEHAEAIRRVYDENMRIVGALAVEYGFQPVWFWQPVVFTKRQTPYEREKAAQYAWLADPFAVVGGRVAGTLGDIGPVRFRDLSHLLDRSDDLLFIDFCHTTEAANRAIAAAIADEVEPLLAAFEGGKGHAP